MALKRKQAPNKLEPDWFSFSVQLNIHLGMDYMSMKLMLDREPLLTGVSILVKTIEVAEKALKLFAVLHSKTPTPLSDSRKDFGHNVEKVRSECANYNSLFDGDEIKEYCKFLNDKGGALYQKLRYGSQDNTIGFQADITECVKAAEKIYFITMMNIPDSHLEIFCTGSPLFSTVWDTKFDLSKNREEMVDAIKLDNEYFDKYCDLTVKYVKEEFMGEKINSFDSEIPNDLTINNNM